MTLAGLYEITPDAIEPLPTLILCFLVAIHLTCIYHEYQASPIKITCRRETALITKYCSDSNSFHRIRFLDFLKDSCPGIYNAQFDMQYFFYPTITLFSGHLQTIWASITARKPCNLVKYTRELVELEDGGCVSLDWCPGFEEMKVDNSPVVILVHGLIGGSHEAYIQETINRLMRDNHNRDLKRIRCVAFNCRGCNDTPVVTRRSYTAGDSNDLKQAIQHIQSKLPHGTPLIGVGFSMGSNILLKYAGEEGDECPLQACMAIGCPFDLSGCARALQRTFIGKYLYSASLASQLVTNFSRYRHLWESCEQYNMKEIFDSKTVTEFAQNLTSIDVGYRSVHEYYRKASCAQYIPDIKRPTLVLNALDDTLCPAEIIPYYDILANPNVILLTTERGGHIAWFEVEFIRCIVDSNLVQWQENEIGGKLASRVSSSDTLNNSMDFESF